MLTKSNGENKRLRPSLANKGAPPDDKTEPKLDGAPPAKPPKGKKE